MVDIGRGNVAPATRGRNPDFTLEKQALCSVWGLDEAIHLLGDEHHGEDNAKDDPEVFHSVSAEHLPGAPEHGDS